MVVILGLRHSKHLEQGLQFIISILKLSALREWNISVHTWDIVLRKLHGASCHPEGLLPFFISAGSEQHWCPIHSTVH